MGTERRSDEKPNERNETKKTNMSKNKPALISRASRFRRAERSRIPCSANKSAVRARIDKRGESNARERNKKKTQPRICSINLVIFAAARLFTAGRACRWQFGKHHAAGGRADQRRKVPRIYGNAAFLCARASSISNSSGSRARRPRDRKREMQ